MSDPKKDGLSVNMIVTAGAMGVGGFLMNDFVGQRDGQDAFLATAVRSLEIQIAPLVGDFEDMQDTLNSYIRENRESDDRLRARMIENTGNIALMERNVQEVEARLDRLTEIVRERSLERMNEQ